MLHGECDPEATREMVEGLTRSAPGVEDCPSPGIPSASELVLR